MIGVVLEGGVWIVVVQIVVVSIGVEIIGDFVCEEWGRGVER